MVMLHIEDIEVVNDINSLNNSSPGWDDIPSRLAKRVLNSYIKPIRTVFMDYGFLFIWTALCYIKLRQVDSDLRNNLLHYTTLSIHSSISNSLLYYPPVLKYTYMCIVIYFTFYVVLIIHVDNLFNHPFILYLRNCQVNLLKEISKNPEHSLILHLYLHDIQIVHIIIDNSIIYEINIFLELIFTITDHTSTYTCIIVCYMFPYQMSYCNPSEINEQHTLILPLLSVLTLQITIMDNINDILYIFLFTLFYISIIPFTSIFHTITIFTNHIVYYINVLCYLINRHPRLYPYLHTINIIHLVILRFNDVPRIHVFICPTIHCYKGMSITFDDTCMRIPILNGTMFYFVIIIIMYLYSASIQLPAQERFYK